MFKIMNNFKTCHDDMVSPVYMTVA